MQSKQTPQHGPELETLPDAPAAAGINNSTGATDKAPFTPVLVLNQAC